MDAGQRIGNWFLWLEISKSKTKKEEIPIITARSATCGGDVLMREIATMEMADQLRAFAQRVEDFCTEPATDK